MSSIKNTIIEKTKEMYDYDVLECHESKLKDEEGDFKVYTIFLDLKKRDYSKLIEEEWRLSEELGLYDKRVIVRYL